jgi:hypothetical protein
MEPPDPEPEPEPPAAASPAPAAAAPVPSVGEEAGQGGAMLHRLVDAEDPVEDAGAGLSAAALAAPATEGEEQGQDEGAREEPDAKATAAKATAVLVGRPTPSVLHLGAALLDRATGVLSALRFNVNRDAGPLDTTLLKAR